MDRRQEKQQAQTGEIGNTPELPETNKENHRPEDRERTEEIWRHDSDRDQKDDNAYIIVECKKKNRKDGKSQLEDYLRFSKAYLGVWFNGNERLYLQKTEKDGKVIFTEIPNIPRFGERVEDIGKFKRKDYLGFAVKDYRLHICHIGCD